MAGVERARVANDLLEACGPPAATANLETDGAAQRGDRASDSSAGPVPERGLSRSATARRSAPASWPWSRPPRRRADDERLPVRVHEPGVTAVQWRTRSASMEACHAVFGTGDRARTLLGLAHGEVLRDL